MPLLPTDPKKRRLVILGIAGAGAVILYVLTRGSSSADTPATVTADQSGLPPTNPVTSGVTDPGTGSASTPSDTPPDTTPTDPPQITIVVPGDDPEAQSGGNAPATTPTTPAGSTTPSNVTTRPAAGHAVHNGAATTGPAPPRATRTTVKPVVVRGATMGPATTASPTHGNAPANVPKAPVEGRPAPQQPATPTSTKPSEKQAGPPPKKAPPPPPKAPQKATPPHKKK